MQKTIAQRVSFSGKGMHSGRNAEVQLMPARENTGFRFHRLDAKDRDKEPEDQWILASIDSVIRYPACTCLANEQGASVRTVEHLLAACFAMGIDNLEIEITGEEIPVLDGSAEPIVQLIESVGVAELAMERRVIEIIEPVYYEDEHRKFAFEPHPGFALDINIYPAEYGHMQWATEMTPELLRKEIVAAKAWGRLKDIWLPKIVGHFLKRPVLRGAGLNTAIVYAFGRPLNPSGLRYVQAGLNHPSEIKRHDMVRHKVLDIIGDLQLLGADIKGRVICHSSAHVTNHAGMKLLMENKNAWKLAATSEL